MRFLVALIVGLALLNSCSSKDNSVGPDNHTLPPADTPVIPLPKNPGDALPESSDTLVIDTSLLGTFSPQHLARPSAIIARFAPNPVWLSPSSQHPLLVEKGAIVPSVGFRCGICYDRQCYVYHYEWVPCPGLQSAPRIQYARYWRKIFSTTLQYPTTYSESHTYTEGTSETTGESFAYTVGVSASIWGIGLSAEFSKTFSHEITISSETSVTKEFTVQSVSGKTIVATAWQLVDLFRIVDENGYDYQDPGFTLDTPPLGNATTQVFLSVVEF